MSEIGLAFYSWLVASLCAAWDGVLRVKGKPRASFACPWRPRVGCCGPRFLHGAGNDGFETGQVSADPNGIKCDRGVVGECLLFVSIYLPASCLCDASNRRECGNNDAFCDPDACSDIAFPAIGCVVLNVCLLVVVWFVRGKPS